MDIPDSEHLRIKEMEQGYVRNCGILLLQQLLILLSQGNGQQVCKTKYV